MIGIAEGRLTVALAVRNGAVARVDIRSTRLLDACRVLAGKPVAQALAVLPRLFALCGVAQQAAGLTACEQALDIVPSTGTLKARQTAVQVETALDHGMRVLMDWSALAGEPPPIEAVRRFRAALARIRTGEAPCTGSAEARTVLGEWLGDAGADPSAFRTWAETGQKPAARLFARLYRDGLAGYGASSVALMTALDEVRLAARLAEDRTGGFVARPDAAGRVLETGPLARQAADPLVAGLVAAHRNGLIARFAARLRELLAVLDGLAGQTVPVVPAVPTAWCGSGCGLGVVEAARGRLIHRVEIADGVVARYQILAPTEWNFHPRGPLAEGLCGDRADQGLAARTRLLVAALDPCVACDVEIADA